MELVENLPDGKYNVGIKLSGGADSSLIYYALCNKFKDNPDVNIIPITLATDRKPYYIPYAKQVIKIVEKLNGKSPLIHLTNTIKHDPVKYDSEQTELVKKATSRYDVKYWFSGLTRNPPVDEMTDFFIKNHKTLHLNLDRIMKSIKTRDITRDTSDYKFFDESRRPYTIHDKKEVAYYYNYYNMLDSLYPYTHSCEDVQSFNKKGNALHCGECFFCLERWWGFGRLI
jgi:hypothetical protein